MTPEILAILISSASHLSGYSIPPLTVEYVPDAFFDERVCGYDCDREGAYLDEGTTIYLHEKFEGNTSLVVLSLVIHESVHVAQHLAGQGRSCEEMQRREREAYRVQNLWLEQNYHMPVRAVPYGACR